MNKKGGLTKSLSLDQDQFPTLQNLKSSKSSGLREMFGKANFLKVDKTPADDQYAASPSGKISRSKSRERFREQRERIIGLSSSDEEPQPTVKSPVPKSRKKLLRKNESLLGPTKPASKKRYTRSKTEENFSPSYNPEEHGSIIEVTHLPQQETITSPSWRTNLGIANIKTAGDKRDAFKTKVRAHRSMENLNQPDEEDEDDQVPIGDLISRFNQRNKPGRRQDTDRSSPNDPKPLKSKRLSWISDFFDKSKKGGSVETKPQNAGPDNSPKSKGRRKISDEMIKRRESLEESLEIRKPKKRYQRSKTVHLDDDEDTKVSSSASSVLSPPQLRRSKTFDESSTATAGDGPRNSVSLNRILAVE